MFSIKDYEPVQAAIAMVIAASMKDKPLHYCHLAAMVDEDDPDQLIAVLDEAAYYGVEVINASN